MGQRLNLEIITSEGGDKDVLASCYYHLGGFTSSSLALTTKAIEGIQELKMIEDKVALAIKVLNLTGAEGIGDNREWKKLVWK